MTHKEMEQCEQSLIHFQAQSPIKAKYFILLPTGMSSLVVFAVCLVAHLFKQPTHYFEAASCYLCSIVIAFLIILYAV